MAEGLIEDTTLWAEIEDTDADSIAMRFIADNIASWFDMFNEGYEGAKTPAEIADMIGEELAFQYENYPEDYGFDNDSFFEAVCGRIDAYLPYYLENYPPVVYEHAIIW